MVGVMERVVVVVDGTPAAGAAVGWVIARAGARPSAVRVLGVADDLPRGSESIAAEVRRAVDAVVAAAVERLLAAVPDCPVTSSVGLGQSRAEIVAASKDADLLVLGTDRGPGQSGWGTTPIRVAAAAACPTVIVPVARPGGSGSGVVMIGSDSTEQQPAVVDFALREAGASDAPVTVVNSWHVPTLLAVTMFAHPAVYDSIRNSHLTALERTVDHVRAFSPKTEVRGWLREGITAQVLTDDAERASLLVVGRGGRGAVGELLLGSTSHDLLLTMPCPVAVVPQ
jgi:nucleotide-binding universal stress UspA family protein